MKPLVSEGLASREAATVHRRAAACLPPCLQLCLLPPCPSLLKCLENVFTCTADATSRSRFSRLCPIPVTERGQSRWSSAGGRGVDSPHSDEEMERVMVSAEEEGESLIEADGPTRNGGGGRRRRLSAVAWSRSRLATG